MKMSVKRLLAAFGISQCVSAEAKKKIISLRSRGNVKLQLGRVMTSCEYEKQKSEVLAYDFS